MSTFVSTFDDQVLLRRSRAGDSTALDALLQRHTPMAIAYAYSLIGNREDALDAAQAAMLQVAQSIRGEGPELAVKSCVYICTHHAAIDLQRKNISRQKREHLVAVQEKSPAMPTESLEQAEMLVSLREELAGLPRETEVALALFHMDELPVADVARQMGLTVDACKQRLSRGREKLRERLERRGFALAGVALVFPLLGSLFSTGRAFASEVQPHELQRVSGVVSVPEGVSPSAEAANKTGRATSFSRAPVEVAKMSKVVVAVSVLLLILCGSVVVTLITKPVKTGSRISNQVSTPETRAVNAPAEREPTGVNGERIELKTSSRNPDLPPFLGPVGMLGSPA